jgi:hypothetical protein
VSFANKAPVWFSAGTSHLQNFDREICVVRASQSGRPLFKRLSKSATVGQIRILLVFQILPSKYDYFCCRMLSAPAGTSNLVPDSPSDEGAGGE